MKTNRAWELGSACHSRHAYSKRVTRKGPKVALRKIVKKKCVDGKYKTCLTGGEI